METQATYIGHTDVTEGVSKSNQQPWRKVEAIFETFGDFPKRIAFTAMGATVETVVNTLFAGHAYTVSFDLSSREYNGKWYTDAKAWDFRDLETSHPATDAQPKFNSAPMQGDLPF